MSVIRERLLAAFQVEHKEHVQAVRTMLEQFERRQHDMGTLDLVEVYRRIHSLKGAARAVGLRPVEMLAHKLESLISRCQKEALALDRDVCAAIRQAMDEIEDCAAGFASGRTPPESLDTLRVIERLIDEDSSAETGGKVAGRIGATMPPSTDGQPVTRDEAWQQPLESRPDNVGTSKVEETVRVGTAKLDEVLRHAAEVLAEVPRQEAIAREMRNIRRLLAKIERGAAKGGGASSFDVFNEPRDVASEAGDGGRELLAEIGASAQRASAAQQEAAWRLRKVGLDLFGGVRTLRIIPAESVFGSVRQIARELAREEGKQVEVDVAGLETMADRRVLQALKDPIMHLLRNAIHHGIQEPAERIRAGKPAAGQIMLRIAVDRSRLVVLLEEDGRGLDRDRILGEAHRRGIVAKEEAVPDDPRWLTRILVQPNFSTAPVVTEVSGRGIGLSVVDKAVRQCQGAFELRQRASGGTVARISVPLAISGNRLLLARCRSQTYGIPAQWVERLYRLPIDKIATVNGEPTIWVEDLDTAVPLVSLSQLVGQADAAVSDSGGLVLIALLRIDDARLAVGVDEVGSLQDGIIQDLDGSLSQIGLLSGGAILGDGSVALVLNPPALLARASEGRRHWHVSSGSADGMPLPPCILVVDDSITTRTLERSILEARGFRVLLSVDGLDALDQLRREHVDLVIVDIEMPRMDGFELLRAMKQDEALSNTPVVLVTSRDSPQDRHKGLTLGAEAYIVKQRFDQRDLMRAIEQIL